MNRQVLEIFPSVRFRDNPFSNSVDVTCVLMDGYSYFNSPSAALKTCLKLPLCVPN